MQRLLLLSILGLLLASSCSKEYANYALDNGFADPSPATGDNYEDLEENPFIDVSEQAVSTFSIDADGASYTNMRRFITQENQLPPKAAIRTEELINFFNLDYPFDGGAHPVSLNGEVATCPWNTDNKLIRIGLKGKPIAEEDLPPSNYVFLIDVSGSMNSEDKLDLLKQGFKLFVNTMDDADRIAIVTYAGSADIVLESTSGAQKSKIIKAIDKLGAGGSTAGAEGIVTAYQIAEAYKVPNGNNRIIIGTDGDFNVGITDHDELIDLIEEKRESGIFITVLGVGRGNLNDATLEQIANHGNGNYEYLDKLEQLKKVFIYEANKFYTVAKDVKVQVTFNPEIVEAYRLIGYENRLLAEEDFEDDTKDAGEIGSGQSITALYEIVPASGGNTEDIEAFTIDFNYKLPDANSSIPMELDIYDNNTSFEDASDFMQFTASIAAYSMLLTDSQYTGSSTYNSVIQWLNMAELTDEHFLKAEFQNIVEAAQGL
ncbi:MAG: VWA domain-containing protein [Bacteroidetes bacterium]|nr:VWA domain-containing protein [Bacteroidota bacterium]